MRNQAAKKDLEVWGDRFNYWYDYCVCAVCIRHMFKFPYVFALIYVCVYIYMVRRLAFPAPPPPNGMAWYVVGGGGGLACAERGGGRWSCSWRNGQASQTRPA